MYMAVVVQYVVLWHGALDLTIYYITGGIWKHMKIRTTVFF